MNEAEQLVVMRATVTKAVVLMEQAWRALIERDLFSCGANIMLALQDLKEYRND